MSIKLKAAAYDLSPHVDAEIRARLFDPETNHDLTDVVRKLRDSHTPGWLYYYLNEVETPAHLGSGLAALVGDETVNEVAREYAESDTPRINLATPGASNWMSEEPLAPVRNSYEDKCESIGEALATAYAEAFRADFPTFDDDEFQTWFTRETLDQMNLLKWAMYEQEAASRGADDPTMQVANWWVARTRGYKIGNTLASYETRNDTDEDYFDAIEDYSTVENDEYVERDYESDTPDVPLVTPYLPDRDFDTEKLHEVIDREEDADDTE